MLGVSPALTTLLGGMTPETFLRRHWQKRPLVVRQAFPGFAGVVSLDAMLALAQRDDVRSRLVLERPRRQRGRWELHEGPFELDTSALPRGPWTLLVQGLESLVPGAWDVLRAFSFLPAARVDDLMVSYASPGGSVGPHDDLYDVFLLQGPGRRRWRFSSNYTRTYLDDAPMRVLRSFTPEQDVVLEPGDMLYLPPRVAHWGTAEGGPCFTYSIGFLAPSRDALAQNFLAYLAQERGSLFRPDDLYADPDLKRPADPWALDDRMVAQVIAILDELRWDLKDVADFTGRLLTGPKPGVAFASRSRPFDDASFTRLLTQPGELRLALPTRMLVRGDVFFVNGEAYTVGSRDHRLMRSLLESRRLPLPVRAGPRARDVLRLLVNAGAIEVGRRRGKTE